MEQLELPKGSAIQAYWKDSAYIAGWQSSTEDCRAKRIVSIGYTVATSPESLTITTSVDEDWDFITPLSIPWGCIERVVTIGDAWKR